MTLSASPKAQDRAAERWRGVADRLRTVSPQALTRGAIGVALLALAVGLVVGTWPSLLPFAVGAIIAYAVLPIANRLDRYMPRVLAAILAELVAVAILVGVSLVVVPPVLNGLVRFAQALPSAEEVRVMLENLQLQLGELPEPARGIVLALATEVSGNLSQTLSELVRGAGDFVTAQLLGILGTASFLIGLLVIPAWILTIVADERDIKRRAVSILAPAVRSDVVAGFRIVDRALATFLRVRVLMAIVAGFLVWVGLSLASALGLAEFPFAVSASVLLGSLLLIPELGFFLGLFPILLVLVIAGPLPAAIVFGVYFAAARIAEGLVETRVSRGVLDVHPGLLIPAIVVLSGFGLIWLLAAAPVVAILRDLVRYAAGRLGDPPAPAGVLPGERRRRAAAAAVAAAPVPSVYRDRPGPRQGTAAIVPATATRVTVTARSPQQ